MHELLRRTLVALLTKLAFAFSVLGVLGAVLIVAGQCLSWLLFDSWPEITVIHGVTALGWSVPATWFGEKAINMVLDLPLSFVVLALGLALRELFAGLAVLCRAKVKQAT
jgi:hypothetical protein